MSDYILSADLGQQNDYTGVSILHLPDEEQMNVVDLTRLPLGQPYPEQVFQIKRRFDALTKIARGEGGQVALCLDATGVGAAVVDIARSMGLEPAVIKITGGQKMNQSGNEYHVPKKDLIGAAQVAFQNGNLRIAKNLPTAEALKSELAAFKMKINIATGNQTFEAWREKDHDDLVLSVSMAVWLAKYWRDNHFSEPDEDLYELIHSNYR